MLDQMETIPYDVSVAIESAMAEVVEPLVEPKALKPAEEHLDMF